MRHLLDTQILIWAVITPERLALRIKNLLQNNEILVSQITFFEIAINQKIGKLPQLDLPVAELSHRVEQDGFNLLPLQTSHIAAYDDIPLLPTHRDPFDRILLATALSENIPIISAEANFELYSPHVQIIMN